MSNEWLSSPHLDDPEIIACCLHCTQLGCSGECEKVRTMMEPGKRRIHSWTAEEKALLRKLHSQGMKDRKIAEIMGLKTDSVKAYRLRLGLKSKRG